MDRALYLSRSWAEDGERKAEAGIPEDIGFVTRPELAMRMLERAFKAGVPASWVTGDSVYGSARYVLGPFAQDSDLRWHGQKTAERGGKSAKKRAIVAVARKLSVLCIGCGSRESL